LVLTLTGSKCRIVDELPRNRPTIYAKIFFLFKQNYRASNWHISDADSSLASIRQFCPCTTWPLLGQCWRVGCYASLLH